MRTLATLFVVAVCGVAQIVTKTSRAKFAGVFPYGPVYKVWCENAGEGSHCHVSAWPHFRASDVVVFTYESGEAVQITAPQIGAGATGGRIKTITVNGKQIY